MLQPASVFTNGVGLLGGAGRSHGLAVNIPDDPSLAYQGFHVQALLATPSGPKLTNDLSLTIQPPGLLPAGTQPPF